MKNNLVSLFVDDLLHKFVVQALHSHLELPDCLQKSLKVSQLEPQSLVTSIPFFDSDLVLFYFSYFF